MLFYMHVEQPVQTITSAYRERHSSKMYYPERSSRENWATKLLPLYKAGLLDSPSSSLFQSKWVELSENFKLVVTISGSSTVIGWIIHFGIWIKQVSNSVNDCKTATNLITKLGQLASTENSKLLTSAINLATFLCAALILGSLSSRFCCPVLWTQMPWLVRTSCCCH